MSVDWEESTGRVLIYPMTTADAYYLAKLSEEISKSGYDVRVSTNKGELVVILPVVKRTPHS